MMKKILILCAAAQLLWGCSKETTPEGPVKKPVTPELQQKISDLNAGLTTLKTLTEVAAHSEVTALEEGEAGSVLTFRDGTQVTVVCAAEGVTPPLIGMAEESDTFYWTLASQQGTPWLKDAAGARMPVSGPVPVAGIDDEGFWTVQTEGTPAAWRITDADGKAVAATQTQAVALFRSVTEAGGEVTVVLTDGNEFPLDKLTDLSTTATANCYVVSVPGKYLFKASVRGNGVGTEATTGYAPEIELADGMTADWLWTDSEGLVSEVSLDQTAGEISFTLSAGAGNTLIALMKGGTVIWSWHIWATDAPESMTYENGTVFLDRNVGATGTTVGGPDAFGMYYQWGRKDPFYCGTATEDSANPFLQAKKNTVVNPAVSGLVWGITKSPATLAVAAANPMTFYNGTVGTATNWVSTPKATLWDADKTLNDPCPVGYKVPDVGAWSDLSSGRNYIDGVSEWDKVNTGMTYTFDGKTAWYPAQGYRFYSYGTIVGLASSGGCWSSKASSVKSYYLYFKKSGTSGSLNPELDVNRSYGYTVRCCKE